MTCPIRIKEINSGYWKLYEEVELLNPVKRLFIQFYKSLFTGHFNFFNSKQFTSWIQVLVCLFFRHAEFTTFIIIAYFNIRQKLQILLCVLVSIIKSCTKISVTKFLRESFLPFKQLKYAVKQLNFHYHKE